MTNGADILLRHLPEVFHSSEDQHPPEDQQILFKILDVFGEVLFGAENGSYIGLEQIIANLPNLFDPGPGQVISGSTLEARTPNSFLPWLAEWVALGQLQGVSEERTRELICRVVTLYYIRGTKGYLEELLGLFFPEIHVSINDKELPSMKVGQSRIGTETRLGGDIPFCFFVVLRFKTKMYEQSQQHKQLLERVRSVIDLAKPAHTAYQLECFFEG